MAIVHRLLSPLVEVRKEESTTLLLMFLYSFLAMTSYNILKPLAAGMFVAVHSAENLPLMLLVAGPLIAVIMLRICSSRSSAPYLGKPGGSPP
jgi:ATP/ADP translocase